VKRPYMMLTWVRPDVVADWVDKGLPINETVLRAEEIAAVETLRLLETMSRLDVAVIMGVPYRTFIKRLNRYREMGLIVPEALQFRRASE